MKMGKINDSFISFKTKTLQITHLDGESLEVFGDGEILTQGKTLNFTHYPRKLKIFKANT